MDATATLNDHLKKTALTIVCDEYLACLFIKHANNGNYQGVKEKLKNRAQFGNDSYPKMPNDALHYVQNYKTPGGRYRGGNVQHTKQEGVASIQTGKKSGGVHKGKTT